MLRKIKNAQFENQNAVETLRRAHEERVVVQPVVNLDQQAPQSQAQFTHGYANARASNIPVNSPTVSAEQSRQEVFYDNLSVSAGPSHLAPSSSSSTQQLRPNPVPQQVTQFRFPPPPLMRNSSKKSRSSSNSATPPSSTAVTTALVVAQPLQHLGRGFQPPISEQPNQTVKDLVQ